MCMTLYTSLDLSIIRGVKDVYGCASSEITAKRGDGSLLVEGLAV